MSGHLSLSESLVRWYIRALKIRFSQSSHESVLHPPRDRFVSHCSMSGSHHDMPYSQRLENFHCGSLSLRASCPLQESSPLISSSVRDGCLWNDQGMEWGAYFSIFGKLTQEIMDRVPDCNASCEIPFRIIHAIALLRCNHAQADHVSKNNR